MTLAGLPVYCSMEIAYSFFAVLIEHVCVFRYSLTGHSILFFSMLLGRGEEKQWAVGSIGEPPAGRSVVIPTLLAAHLLLLGPPSPPLSRAENRLATSAKLERGLSLKSHRKTL